MIRYPCSHGRAPPALGASSFSACRGSLGARPSPIPSNGEGCLVRRPCWDRGLLSPGLGPTS
eukprot:7277595-Alexandrium_andersonii.AAC.1